MTNPIATILARHPLIVLDGALATELERRGCDLHDRLWSARVLLEQPDVIRAVHESYFAAGADCAITASYQASYPGFAARGMDAVAATALLARSVEIALATRDAFWANTANRTNRPRPFVAASIGPYGAMRADGSEYHGNYGVTDEELLAFHRPRMATLIAAGAELLACETIPSLQEARVLARLLPEFPQISAWMSFSCRDDTHTCHGEPFAECATLLAGHPQIAAVGVNCSAPQYIAGLLRSASDAGHTLLAYPNSGEHYDATDNTWHDAPATTADYGAAAATWYAAGARLIGGCCRTTPDDIAAVAARRVGMTR